MAAIAASLTNGGPSKSGKPARVDSAVLDRELRDLREYGRPERSRLAADRGAVEKLSVISLCFQPSPAKLARRWGLFLSPESA
jgi:hypothetical protein